MICTVFYRHAVVVVLAQVMALPNGYAQGRSWYLRPQLNLRDVQMGAEIHEDQPHFTVSGGVELQLTTYGLIKPAGGFGAWYANVRTALMLRWHAEEARSPEQSTADDGEEIHDDVLVDWTGAADAILPQAAYGRAFSWGVLILGVSLYGDGKRSGIVFGDVEEGVHNDILSHLRGSGGVGLVLVARTQRTAPLCPVLRDTLKAVSRQARDAAKSDEQSAERCADLQAELDGLVERTSGSIPESMFDPDSWRLRLHVGPGGADWRLRHIHHAETMMNRVSPQMEKPAMPEVVYAHSSFWMVLLEGVMPKLGGVVQPFGELRLFLPLSSESLHREANGKFGLRIPVSGQVTLVWNWIGFEWMRLEQEIVHVNPGQDLRITTGLQFEISPWQW
ncbi:hypothetical protein HYW17_05850 [Candidatus Uhrbacteria bacterium]|nr:hypothetical protein [Candidatus Uhrbacteria bacterium]